MQTTRIFLGLVILLAIVAVPCSAAPTHENIDELRSQMQDVKIPQYSLPYTILTAVDSCIDAGYSDVSEELLTEHYKNALLYQVYRGRVSDPVAQQLILSAMMIAYS